jgi:hypothetical protein
MQTKTAVKAEYSATEKLNGNDLWLRQHQITAFWHGFGLSGGGLRVPKSMIENITTKDITIKSEFMAQRLATYLDWLRSYKETWGTSLYLDSYKDPSEFLTDELRHDSRHDILQMIELLQDSLKYN